MSTIKRGVTKYTEATVKIFFPEDNVVCSLCPLMGVEMASGRNYCRRTGEYLTSEKYTIGAICPITFKEENNE